MKGEYYGTCFISDIVGLEGGKGMEMDVWCMAEF